MAIDDLLDEHEQSERVRTWLRDNGAGLLGGIVLGLALIGGWRWWQHQREEARLQAGTQYHDANSLLAAGDLAKGRTAVAGLPAGTYSILGALDLAKAQLDAGKRDEAIATLRAAHSDDPALQRIVDQRLARLLIDAGKGKEALALVPADADAAGQQVRGDAFSALGQQAEAREAYARALVGLEVGSPERNVVELKLSEVGGPPAKPEARS